MNTALVWKEYRQLRGVWIAVTLLVVLLIEGLVATAGTNLSLKNPLTFPRPLLFFIVFSGIAAHGIVAGAMLIAKDKEDGTQTLLDSLTCRRTPLWWNKIAAGLVMVALQGLALVAVLAFHGASTPEESALLPLLGMAALGWGALGGALCQHVLSATLLATFFMAISWMLTVPLGAVPDLLIIVEGLCTLGAFLLAQNTYCRSDRMRLPEDSRHAALRFLGRYLAILVTLLAAAVFLAAAWALSMSFQVQKQLLIAAEIGVSTAILITLRGRVAGWQLILVAAGLTAIMFFTFSQMLQFSLASIPQLFLGVELAACAGAALLNRLSPRREFRRWAIALPYPDFIHSWKAVLWLIARQGKWLFLGIALLALASGLTARLAPLLVWPVGSMLLGIACGLGVFCPDQREGRLYWSAQRLPTVTIWFAKVVTWLGLLVVALGLGWMGDTWWSLREGQPNNSSFAWLLRWQGITNQSSPFETARRLDSVLFFLLWPSYGFAIALILGQLVRRPVIAAILAVFLVPGMLALWMPSFLIGGLSIWQVMMIPALLLLVSAASQNEWISDRLLSPKSLTILGVSCLLSVAWLAGSLWDRIAEVPDVGEPFDRKAFLTELQPFQNKTGVSLAEILRSLPPTEISSDDQRSSASREQRPETPDAMSPEQSPMWLEATRFDRTIWARWRKPIEAKLNGLFTSAWYGELQRVAASPLGLVDDVRNHQFANLGLYGARPGDKLGNLMDWRIAQLIESGDYAGALQVFGTGLKVARQLENFSSFGSYASGVDLETALLGSSLDRWLRAVKTDRVLLQAAERLLRDHVAARPDPAGALKTQIIIDDSLDVFETASKSTLDTTYRWLAIQVPWEKSRQQRVKRAAAYGALSALGYLGPAPPIPTEQQNGPAIAVAQSAELPPRTGVGANVAANVWGTFLLQSWPVNPNYELFVSFALAGENSVKAAQIAIALQLYQFDHHKIPANLEDLVPNYLPSLPIGRRGENPWVEWVETDEIASPCVTAGLVGQGSPLGQSPWQLAMSINSISDRLPPANISPDESQPFAGGMLAPGMAAGTPEAGLETVFAHVNPEPLVPRPIIHVGSYTFGRAREFGSSSSF